MKIDLATFLPYQLTNVATRVSNDFAEVYQTKYGLNIPQWRILANLAQYGQSNAKDLCTQANMDKSTVSRAVKVLIDKGLVKSELNAQDKRAALLVLSKAGQSLYENIAPDALNWEKQLLSTLTNEEYGVLVSIFEKLNNKLKA
ncbi:MULTISPECIES: MarR family winged helix-turn-helix transcriptional regulator [Pseudoalteromonas]|uniref:MarR family transcriptional regulator n=1 Tax=Pseudoalteromonas fuliginea TaxID=1872678 RepID=A0ABD3Y9K8_9GAMM|nr:MULTISPECIES: MarR family transcriptional regulator [Pseudoalteromonas]ALQ10156.1 MarR family transcriptional regulator [Pseudoalteromonas sp. Bsw20308]KDC50988.1 MarR family transcriptional regulator [Pseudoalteromonas fuliginea]KDC55568.1 MarR family transcriptional regulator [Pseudoalteromonas sp. S3431]KJZ28375.1 MarR family transcriptional regulator [Pseudoalteromonas fuliginea]